MTIDPLLDAGVRDRVAQALGALTDAAVAWQRAKVAEVSYPQVPEFGFEERQWRSELGRLLGAMEAEGLVEIVR